MQNVEINGSACNILQKYNPNTASAETKYEIGIPCIDSSPMEHACSVFYVQ